MSVTVYKHDNRLVNIKTMDDGVDTISVHIDFFGRSFPLEGNIRFPFISFDDEIIFSDVDCLRQSITNLTLLADTLERSGRLCASSLAVPL